MWIACSCHSCSATPGSDSPGEAVEAEEIIKQLDIEPAEEMPSSTLTSTEGIAPMLPQRLPMTSDTSIEQGEIVTETDMPPLTGMDTFLLNPGNIVDRHRMRWEDKHSLQIWLFILTCFKDRFGGFYKSMFKFN